MSGWATLRAHQAPVRTVDFNDNGLQLVSGDEAGLVCWWSLETRRPLLLWTAHENALLATKFWRENLIVTHGRDNMLHIWRAEVIIGSEKPPLVYSQDVNALNFCPVALAPLSDSGTSSSLVFATPASTASERIDVYRLDDNFKLSRPFKALDASEALPLDTQLEDEAHSSQRRGLLGTVMVLRLTEKWLIAGYESGHVAVFDRGTGSVLTLVQPHKSPVLSLEIATPEFNLSESSASDSPADSAIAFVSSADRKLTRVHLITGENRPVAHLEHRGVASLSLCDSFMATAGWDGKVRLFRAFKSGDLEEVTSFPGGRQSGITAAAIARTHPDSKRRLKPLPPYWIAVAGKDGRVGLFAIENAVMRLDGKQ